MNISDDELEALEPVTVVGTKSELMVKLASGQKVVSSRPWYPRLLHASVAQRAVHEVSPSGVHWPEIDESLSVEGMLLGAKAPGGREPQPA